LSYRIFYNCYFEGKSYLQHKYKELEDSKYLYIDKITGERETGDTLESFDFYLNAKLEDYSKQFNVELTKLYSEEKIVYIIKKFQIKRS
jgi:hypothetical protein